MQFETRRLGKSFGRVNVLEDIDFEVAGGTCHAIVGANGAGKSTFINILSGVFDSYHGTVVVDGREVEVHSPLAARRLNIGCVHQEFDQILFPNVSLLENVLLPLHAGRRPLRRFPTTADWQEAKVVLERVGLRPTRQEWMQPIQGFRPAFRQKVAIATVLAQGAKLIIFDEPTSSLGYDDSQNLLELIMNLKADGIAVIYISHHLSEVVEIADDISVFRSGKHAALYHADEPDLLDKIVGQMLDASADGTYPPRTARSVGQPLLQLKDVTVPMHLRGIALTIHPGEILGITGLIGSGKSSLMKVLYGLLKPTTGELFWQDKPIRTLSVPASIGRGVVLVPEDRRNLGLILNDTITHNLTLPNLASVRRGGFISQRLERGFAQAVADSVHLVTHQFNLNVSRLSGGNQQKVVLGKWLAKKPRVLLLDEPTKGIDVGAKWEIYRLLQELAAQGVAVVIATSEPEEALGVADRVAVMRAGEILDTRLVDAWTLEDILRHATGGVLT